MNEKTKKIIVGVLAALIFLFAVFLVAAGQRMDGREGLGRMLIGLAALIALMWIYNRKFR